MPVLAVACTGEHGAYWPLRAYPGFLIEGEYGHVNVSNRGDCARVRDPGWLPVVASCDNLVLEAH